MTMSTLREYSFFIPIIILLPFLGKKSNISPAIEVVKNEDVDAILNGEVEVMVAEGDNFIRVDVVSPSVERSSSSSSSRIGFISPTTTTALQKKNSQLFDSFLFRRVLFTCLQSYSLLTRHNYVEQNLKCFTYFLFYAWTHTVNLSLSKVYAR